MSQDFPSYRGQMEYRCLGCGKTHPGDSLLYTCPDCGGVFLLHDNNFDELKKHDGAYWRDVFDKRLMTRTTALRGVFAYYELLAPILEEEDIVPCLQLQERRPKPQRVLQGQGHGLCLQLSEVAVPRKLLGRGADGLCLYR